MKRQSNTWVFTIYTSAVKEKHQKRWYDNSIPDSDDPGSPIFCANFRQDNSTLLTTWKTSSFTGTVSIIDTKARRHNSSEELQTYNHHFQILSKKVTNIRIIGKKKNQFPTCSQPGLRKAYEGIYQYWTPWTIPKESQPNPYKLEQERILESTNEKSTKILST